MKYISTRGEAPPRDFLDVLLSGTAPDGGLYMPEAWPRLSAPQIARFSRLSYEEVALEILFPFVEGTFSREELASDIAAAYRTFDTRSIVPVVPLGRDLNLIELFHGPTFAFKDIALQLLAQLIARGLAKRGETATIVVATSGDTGAAAVAALGGLKNIELFVLHPAGRVSEIQRRQMTTSGHENVHNLALTGTFDDAQAIVKGLFADVVFARRLKLMAVNSINLARILIQSVYYFTSAAVLRTPGVFAVPTGNFGDVFAGEAATRMGLPIEKLLVATNANDIMVRTLNDGIHAVGETIPTLSPAMDIQIASNFERALFEAAGRDTVVVRTLLGANNRRLQIPASLLSNLQVRYSANRASDQETLATIRLFRDETGRVVDPHTAVALAAARKTGAREGTPMAVLSTAHPAKFPEAVEAALGEKTLLPERLSNLLSKAEKVAALEPKLPLVRAYIEARLAHHESGN